MGKIFKMIGNWVRIAFNKVDGSISKTAKLELELDKMRETLADLENSYDEVNGKLITAEKELKVAKERKESLINLGKQMVQGEHTDENLKKLQDKVKKENLTIQNLTSHVEMSKNIITKLDLQIKDLESKIDDYTSKTDSIKMKDEFSKDVKKISKVMNSEFKSEFDDIAKDIENEYNASTFKADRMETKGKDEIEDMLSGNDFDSFKKELMK